MSLFTSSNNLLFIVVVYLLSDFLEQIPYFVSFIISDLLKPLLSYLSGQLMTVQWFPYVWNCQVSWP